MTTYNSNVMQLGTKTKKVEVRKQDMMVLLAITGEHWI